MVFVCILYKNAAFIYEIFDFRLVSSYNEHKAERFCTLAAALEVADVLAYYCGR